VLPSGAPVAGRLADGFQPEDVSCCAGAETFTNAVSGDGSRISFQANGNLYLRVNAEQPQSPVEGEGTCSVPTDACTLQLDASEDGGEGGGGRFMWATPDGVRVFFLDERQLTRDATAAPGAPDLYEYDTGSPAGERLRDLSAHAGEPADVLGVSGASEDGGYVYFVADGKLIESANSAGSVAIAGQPNLYLAHAGAITFIATLDSTPSKQEASLATDEPDWKASMLTARVTPDGTHLAFNSDRPLTGYDNVDVATGERDDEIFLYDAHDDTLACVSCSPTGAPSTAYAKIPVPTKPVFGGGGPFSAAGLLQRNLTDDGRVFFSTAQRLLGAATNGQSNVYEYDAGALHLISTGTSPDPSYFYEASANGGDVFLITSQALPSGASADEFRVYDAREGGGFPVPAGGEACSEEGCRGPAPLSTSFPAPATVNSLGSGNVPPAAAGVKGVKVAKTAAQLRRERLSRALELCRKLHQKHKRSACEAKARHKYGPTKRPAPTHAGKPTQAGKR